MRIEYSHRTEYFVIMVSHVEYNNITNNQVL